MIDLLQITDSLTQAVKKVAGDRNGDGYLGFGELITTGGWIMIPLGIMLVAAVYVFAERSIAIRNAFSHAIRVAFNARAPAFAIIAIEVTNGLLEPRIARITSKLLRLGQST